MTLVLYEGGGGVPGPYAALLLGLAAFRVWHLLAEDTVFDGVRRRVFRLYDWTDGPFPAGYRSGLDDFVGCPWCAGFWVAVVFWLAWVVWPDGALVVAVPLALSAVVGVLGR